MKKILMTGAVLLMAAMTVLFVVGCPDADTNQTSTDDATIRTLRITSPGFSPAATVTLGTPAATAAGVTKVGAVTLKSAAKDEEDEPTLEVKNPTRTINLIDRSAKVEYATGTVQATPGAFSATFPTSLKNNEYLFVKVTSGKKTQYYVIKVTVQFAGSNITINPDDPLPPISNFDNWASDSYNQEYRMFPSAPDGNEILTYPWGSGTNNYFDQNATVDYWKNKHIHKYPDVFHFANGRPVRNIADFELRQQEIFNILQYYMHGRMPSIDPEVVNITWTDSGNNSNITVTHIESGRTANINVSVTLGTNVAAAGSRQGILAFGVGGAPSARAGQSTSSFSVSWGSNSESARTGTVVTLYGLTGSALDTPSVNMSYAWAMSVILTAIEGGAFGGRYDPTKVTIYGFSRYGKGAMCIGAFAKGRGGSQIGATFIGSAGAGGPVVDRFIPQAGYLNHTADPLPWDGPGATVYEDLKGITWYQRSLTGATVEGISIATPAASSGSTNYDREVVRGWNAQTPGMIDGSLIYGETTDWTFLPHTTTDFGWIQNLIQARHEQPGWFNARFDTLGDLHDGLNLDMDHSTNPQTNRGREGIACNLPADSHYIAALIAPRIVYYEDGYNTRRNNPEGQWANWILTDEIYRMYAEELNDPTIIWRNTIKMYHITHGHQSYQDADERALIDNLWAETPKTEQELKAALMKLRTPPFPIDDPRYRFDFNRMDVGRPGHPTIAERVYKMRNSPVKVKPMDWRGLLDDPEPLN